MNGMELVLVFLKPVDAVRVFQGRGQDVVEPQISQRPIRRTPLVNELPEPSPELLGVDSANEPASSSDRT